MKEGYQVRVVYPRLLHTGMVGRVLNVDNFGCAEIYFQLSQLVRGYNGAPDKVEVIWQDIRKFFLKHLELVTQPP